MTVAPPPIPEIDAVLKLPNEIDGNLEYHNAFTEAKVLARDAEWMERITALEADRNMLRSALQWMLDNDDTNEGDEPVEGLDGQSWNEYNAYWIEGLNNARNALEKTK